MTPAATAKPSGAARRRLTPLIGALVAVVASSFAAPAAAEDLSARFMEGAPRDRFVFEHRGACALESVVLTLDLSATAAGLYFDVSPAGVGLEVSQPVRVVEGAQFVASQPRVVDGDRSLTVALINLIPGARVTLTGDLDDVAPASVYGRTRIGGSEILGAVLRAQVDGRDVTAAFDVDGVATLALCPVGVS